MKNVLIAGVSGYLGRYVAQEFKKQGYIVHALVRNAKKVEDIADFIDHVITAEVTDKKSLEGICKGIDIVFSSVGITKQKDNTCLCSSMHFIMNCINISMNIPCTLSQIMFNQILDKLTRITVKYHTFLQTKTM